MGDPRRCDFCGAEIDPIDWCDGCMKGNCKYHRRPRKRKDAKYCNDECRTTDHNQLRKIQRDMK